MKPSGAISKFRNAELHRDAGGQLYVTINGRRFGSWPQCRPLIPADAGDLFQKDLADVLDWDLAHKFVVLD